jgi:hypothetical protein
MAEVNNDLVTRREMTRRRTTGSKERKGSGQGDEAE